MARKAKVGAKKANAKAALNKSKKDKNIFKVKETKGKKQPKTVEGTLKKIQETVRAKREKVDANLKELHKDMVVKKPKPTTSNTPIKKQKAVASSKKVSQKLKKLKV